MYTRYGGFSMTWLNVYIDTLHRNKVDEMILEDISAKDIYNYLLSKNVKKVTLIDVEDYVENWLLAVLKDTYLDYLWLYEKFKGVKMAEYEENDVFQEGFERNKFILESMIARTLYRINRRYKDKGMDDKTFKELNQLILTAIDKISDLNKKNGIPTKEPTRKEIQIDTELDGEKSSKAITKSDLESYLLSKSAEEQKVIQQFITDLKHHFTIINLEDYIHKSKVEN